MLKVVRLSDKAHLPTKGSPFSAGMDLYSAVDLIIEPGKNAVISTDIVIITPPGTYGRVAPRSGLATKHGINVGAGVIDIDYRGPLCVVLFNHSVVPFHICQGDRIAQLICEKIVYPTIKEVTTFDYTTRGKNGFGSSGYH